MKTLNVHAEISDGRRLGRLLDLADPADRDALETLVCRWRETCHAAGPLPAPPRPPTPHERTATRVESILSRGFVRRHGRRPTEVESDLIAEAAWAAAPTVVRRPRRTVTIRLSRAA